MPKIRYFCNCPDALKQQSFLINSPYESHSETRNWGDSGAGVDNETTFCKHVYAVRLLRGELPKSEIPTDIPLEHSQKEREALDQERYQQGYGGHDFSGSWGIAQPRKYKGG